MERSCCSMFVSKETHVKALNERIWPFVRGSAINGQTIGMAESDMNDERFRNSKCVEPFGF
jgi:hypothetical protein